MQAAYGRPSVRAALLFAALLFTPTLWLPRTKASNEAQSNCDLIKGEIELVMSKANKAKEALANAQQVLKDAEPKRKEKQKALKEQQAILAKTEKQLQDGKAELEQLTQTEGALRDSVKKMRGQLEDSKSAQQASRWACLGPPFLLLPCRAALACVCQALVLMRAAHQVHKQCAEGAQRRQEDGQGGWHPRASGRPRHNR
jgi:ABC-type transporter Mla subunit MlaD